MKRLITLAVTLALVLSFSFDADAKRRSRKSESKGKANEVKVIQSEAGLKIPEWGIAIDAHYLPALDELIPGYRVVNILLQNNGSKPIELNPRKDKWVITDNIGKKHKAYNHIRFFHRRLWEKMSDKAKAKLDYPHLVPPGKSVAIDVFFKDEVELANFREISWDSYHFDKEFTILTPYEKHIEVKYGTNKVIDLNQIEPSKETEKEKQYRGARDDYEGNSEETGNQVIYITPDGKSSTGSPIAPAKKSEDSTSN